MIPVMSNGRTKHPRQNANAVGFIFSWPWHVLTWIDVREVEKVLTAAQKFISDKTSDWYGDIFLAYERWNYGDAR